MRSRPQAEENEETLAAGISVLQRLTPCDQKALDRLRSAYADGSPVAFLVADGKSRSGQVIDRFLTSVGENAGVARVFRPSKDATSFMREVVRSIGFKAKDFCLADLEKIFTMYLSFQRSHGSRTVICIEGADDCSRWVFDKLFELAERERRERYGLFVVISGRIGLTHHQATSSAWATSPSAVQEIRVAPLGLPETREFVVQQIKSHGFDDVSQVFDYEAITRLHEISAGNPDTAYELCDESLNAVANQSAFPVTARRVSNIASALGLVPGEAPQHDDEFACTNQAATRSIILNVRMRDQETHEQTLLQDCISIGRDRANVVSIPSLLVSRHHALLIRSPDGVKLMDLGSTNGSYVNDEKVVSCRLESGDTIVLGDCRIEFAVVEPTLDEIIQRDLAGASGPGGRGAPSSVPRAPGNLAFPQDT